MDFLLKIKKKKKKVCLCNFLGVESGGQASLVFVNLFEALGNMYMLNLHLANILMVSVKE